MPATSTDRAASGGSAATGGTTAAAASASPDLASVLGPRLLPIMDLLVSQPDELKDTLIPLIKGMLDHRATIKQRETSHARFDKHLTDEHGVVANDEAGNPKPFIPNSLRSKCPIKPSQLMNNEPEMKQLIGEAAAYHEEYIAKMTDFARRAGQLEINLRIKQLRQKFFDLLKTIALSWIIIKELDGGLPDGAALNREELTHKTIYDALLDASHPVAAAFGVDTGTKLAEEYQLHTSYVNTVTEVKMREPDSEFIKTIITKMCAWIPRLSTGLFDHDDRKDKERIINAALREALKPKAMLERNEDVLKAMEIEDGNGPKAYRDVAREEATKVCERTMAHLKRQIRKNYSGDDKNQSSKPKKNGQESKKSSAALSQKGKSKNSKKGTQGNSQKEQKQQKKKPKGEAAEPKQPTTSTSKKRKNKRKAASLEESNAGGKPKGAGKR